MKMPLLSVAAVLALSGCVTFGSNLDVQDLAGRTAAVPEMLIEDVGSPHTRVLVIHGIGGELCPGYSAFRHRYSNKKVATGTMSDIADQLGLCLLNDPWAGRTGAEQCDEQRPHTFPPEITLTKFEYAKKIDGQACSGQPRLRSYEIYYTGTLESAEQDIIRRDEQILGNRVYLNKRLKEDIVVTGLGDAVAYLGHFGPTIRSAVQGTICDMMSDPDENLRTGVQKTDAMINCENLQAEKIRESRNIYVVSHSLGSNIVFDTLYPNNATDVPGFNKSAGDAFVSNFRAAYLLANQDALINLINTPTEGSVGLGNGLVETKLLSEKIGKRGETYRPTIVGFSDRNDVLSYALGSDVCGCRQDQCLNAVLNVAKFGIPWLVVNPATAHTGYWSDATVASCIAKGC